MQSEQLKNAAEFTGAGGSPSVYKQPGDTIPRVPGSIGGGTSVGGTPEGMLDLPGGMRIPAGALPNPEQLAQIHANAIAKTTGAQLTAAEPFKITENERTNLGKEHLQNLENQFKEGLANKEIASKEFMAKLERSTQLQMNANTNNTQLKIGGMHYMPDADTLKGMQIAGMTGQSNLNMANPAERAAADSIISSGGRLLQPKDADALRAMGQLPPVFDKIEAFAKKYLPDENASGSTIAKLKGMGQKIISGTPFPSDVKDQYDQIKTQALNLGRSLEGATGGRIPVMQIELMLNGMASLGKTKQQVLSDVQNLRNVYTTRANDVLLGGMPAFQKDIIKKTYGFKDASPPSYKHVAVGPNGHTIGSNDGQNWVDATTGQPLVQQ
jgi:hypothetical protein